MLAAPAALFAQDHASAFQQDPVEHFGLVVLTFLIVVGVLAIVFSILRYRGSLSGYGAWAFLALGVAVLPLLTSGFGTVMIFKRAQRVEFCTSCHAAMDPFVKDMQNPDSTSLAAVHFKNSYIPEDQCYQCHTDYGIFGDAGAKTKGMVDVVRNYTHTFKTPIQIGHPYRNNDCLKCHAQSAKWVAAHAATKDDLLAGKQSCLDCHGKSTPAHNVS